MDWFELTAVGATRDLWVHATGQDHPEWGRWTLPDGRDAHDVLATDGPAALGVPVWWTQARDAYGTRLRDWIWDTGRDGVKLLSERFATLLLEAEPRVRVVEVDVRWRSGEPVAGYVGVLEPLDDPGPVHSPRRDLRIGRLQVSRQVRDAVLEAGLTGIEITPADPDLPHTVTSHPDAHRWTWPEDD